MKLKIGQRVLLTLLAVIVPSLVLHSLFTLGVAERILRDKATRQLEDLAEKAVLSVETLVRDSQKTLTAIAQSKAVQDAVRALEQQDPQLRIRALEELDRALLDFQRMDGTLQAIRLFDAPGYVLSKVREGEIISRNGAPSPASGTPSVSSMGDRSFFRNSLELAPGEIWISDLERGWMDEAEYWCPAMVRFSTPLLGTDGRVAAVLVINVWGETAGNLVNRMLTAEEGSAFLVEKNLADPERHGIYLFHQDESCVFGNQTGSRITAFDEYPADIVRDWMSREQGVQQHPESEDILAHRFYSPYGSDERGWVIVVNAKKSFFLGPLAEIKRWILGASALGLLLTLLAALYFTRSLLRPIRTLVAGTHAIGDDLGFRIRTESRDEIGELAEEINGMAEALQAHLEEKQRDERRIYEAEKLASIGEMAAGLAHELNTPLGNIRALSALIRKDLQEGTVQPSAMVEDLRDIENQTQRCSRIVGGLLGFARRQNPELALWDPEALIRQALDLVRLPMEKKEIRTRFECPAALPPFRTDGHLLQQVLVNVLLNAIDAVKPRGEIRIACAERDRGLRISIRDDGEGIRPEHLGRIFDPFFTTKEAGKGTGLGLSVSYGILKNQGGDIEVESEPGKGSEFRIFLPRRGQP